MPMGVAESENQLTCVRRAVWGMIYADNLGLPQNRQRGSRRAVQGMFYADDAGIVSKSTEELAKATTFVLTIF